jgi:tRNA dimethylallyltransferase
VLGLLLVVVLVVEVVIVELVVFVVEVVVLVVEFVLLVVKAVVEVELVVVKLLVAVEFVFVAVRLEVVGVRHRYPQGPGRPPAALRGRGHTPRCHTEAMLRPVVAVVGPTAAGKSELSLALAHALDGEVVNADSMQLYQGMDIGTAKLTPAEQQGVPHHLLDIWPVTRAASVSEYQALARKAIEDIRSRHRTPILVGGSGLYVRAAIDNLQFPGTDAALRASLEDELAVVGPTALHARLAGVDPKAAAAILPGNGRRIVRALEVIELSGRPFSATLPDYQAVYEVVQVGVEMPRAVLDQRIRDRVARMWERGLVDEARRLEAAGLRKGRTASRALGYAQVLRFLDGEGTEAEAAAETVQATRRFVRRQESWFRRDPRVVWVPAGVDLVERALSLAKSARMY